MSTERYVESVARLATLLEPTRRRLFEYVRGQQGPVSRDEAADQLGISRAMAAFHLDRLVESGLLRADYRRLAQGRAGRGTGRPSKLYRRSRRRFEVSVPVRAYELLGRLLAEALNQPQPNVSPRESGRKLGRSLGVRARKRLSARPTPERLRSCMIDLLATIGFEPVARTTDAVGQIRARNCPFDPISKQLPDVVCQAALGIVAGALEGIGADHLEERREPRTGLCCVTLVPAEPVSD